MSTSSPELVARCKLRLCLSQSWNKYITTLSCCK